MKKNFLLFILGSICLAIGFVPGCKKDSTTTPTTHVGTTTSFTEEFENVSSLPSKGWVMTDNSASVVIGTTAPTATWSQGFFGFTKTSWLGFSAFSYTTTKDEFAYSYASYATTNYTLSSWLISPVLSVKNGDKISFYVRADTVGVYTDRMQVRTNNSASADVGMASGTVGGFTNVLYDINPAQAAGGYPTTWTRYEYTFSGISGNIDTRIAFRHYVTNTTNAAGIGIDQFRFQVN